MDPNLHELIHNHNLHHRLVPQILMLLPADDAGLDSLFEEIVASHDPRAFNYILVSALAINRTVDARHLVGGTALFANGDWLCNLAWKMRGEVALHLVEAVRTTVMNLEMHAIALLMAAKWSIEFRGGQPPPNLISEARLLARSMKNVRAAHGLVWALAEMLDDAGLRGVLRAEQPRFCSANIIEAGKQFGKAQLNLCPQAAIALIPDKPDNLIGSGTHVRRAVARVGRNEPCPCGSGKKYKRCCEEKDRERMRHSSDVAGKTRAEVLAEPEPHLTEAKIMAMMPADLSRLDAAKIKPKLLPPYFKMLGGALLVEEAATAFEKLGCDTEEMCEAWDFIIFYVCWKQRLDVARRMVRVRFKDGPLPDTVPFGLRLLLVRDDPARFLEVLEAGGKDALTSTDHERLSSFAHGLLNSSATTIGILCARSLIPLIDKRNATFLLSEIERARDRLNLPPDDPFAEILDRRFADEIADGGKDAEELRKARTRLESKAAEVSQLKDSLEQLRREIRLQEKKAPSSALAPTPAAEPPELRELRDKVRELKSSIAERNNERAAFRRELGEAYADLENLRARQPAAPAPEAPDAEDALLLSGAVEGNHPPRPIEFPRRFNDTLAHLPRQVGRAALIHLGRIAAGDPAAFAGAIRLKAAPDVMRVRVGADHRMLFRLLPECVQLVDLINRRDLERCIESL